MKDTFYVLAKLVWCGECDDYAIEEIVRFKYNVAFASKEIYHYINLHYIHDDYDKGIKEYREGGRLYYYVYDVDDDFDPHCDCLSDALAFYTVYRYQQTEATDDFDRTLHTFKPDNDPVWRISWQKTFSRDITNTYYHAPNARAAKEKWERQYGKEGILIGIEGGPY